jgi:hypothetical protein
MHMRILLALALLAAHASAFSLAPSCAAPARQGALALRANAGSPDAASTPLLGRRTLLAGAAAALPLVLGATPALARPKASDGKWAKHEGAFDAAELEGKPHRRIGDSLRARAPAWCGLTRGPFHDQDRALLAYEPVNGIVPPTLCWAPACWKCQR